ncbi:MAG: hypothetical protein EP299_13870 [Acidobacteria bacterium]|nr:MAG: hypothetical protein EP299_13870 [Acidobacteriota bacterium]
MSKTASQTEKPVFTGCRPVLPVADIAASVTYYCDALGFEVGWGWPDPENPEYEGEDSTLVYVFRGHFELLLESCDGPIYPMKIVVGMPSTDAVDVLAAEYQDSGAKIVEPPELRVWGTYEMLVLDLDGHRLRMLH